jgi:hypothetical protein
MVGDPTAGATYVYDGNGNRVGKSLPNCTSPTSPIVYPPLSGENTSFAVPGKHLSRYRWSR